MKHQIFSLTTDRLNLVVPKNEYAAAILKYYHTNNNHLNKFNGNII